MYAQRLHASAGASYAVLSFASHWVTLRYSGSAATVDFSLALRCRIKACPIVGSSLAITSQPVAQTITQNQRHLHRGASGAPLPTTNGGGSPPANPRSAISAMANLFGRLLTHGFCRDPRDERRRVSLCGKQWREPDATSDAVSRRPPATITSANNATFTFGQAGLCTATERQHRRLAWQAGRFRLRHHLMPRPARLPDADGIDGSPFSFTVQAANGATPAATQSFTLTVVLPPDGRDHDATSNVWPPSARRSRFPSLRPATHRRLTSGRKMESRAAVRPVRRWCWQTSNTSMRATMSWW